MAVYVHDEFGVARYISTLRLNTLHGDWEEKCNTLDMASGKLHTGQRCYDGYIPSEQLTPEEADILGFHGYRLRGDGKVVPMTFSQIAEWERRHEGYEWLA